MHAVLLRSLLQPPTIKHTLHLHLTPLKGPPFARSNRLVLLHLEPSFIHLLPLLVVLDHHAILKLLSFVLLLPLLKAATIRHHTLLIHSALSITQEHTLLILHITTPIRHLPFIIVLHHHSLLKLPLLSLHRISFKHTHTLQLSILKHHSFSIARTKQLRILGIFSHIHHNSLLIHLRHYLVHQHLPSSDLFSIRVHVHSRHNATLQHTSLPLSAEPTRHVIPVLSHKALLSSLSELRSHLLVELHHHSLHPPSTIPLATPHASLLVDEAQAVHRGEVGGVLRNRQDFIRRLASLLPVALRRGERMQHRHFRAVGTAHHLGSISIRIELLDDALSLPIHITLRFHQHALWSATRE